MTTQYFDRETLEVKKTDMAFINTWAPTLRKLKAPNLFKGELILQYPFNWKELGYLDGVSLEDDGNTTSVSKFAQKDLDPLHVAIWGLDQFSSFIMEGDIRGRYNSRRSADWLVENMVSWEKHFFAWPTQKDIPFYNLKKPWLSATVHALGISLLLRVAYLNRDAAYEEAAQNITRLFFLTIKEKGIATVKKGGAIVYEEYQTEDSVLTLAGHLFSLISLYEYARYSKEQTIEKIFHSGVTGLKAVIEKFDTGTWLLYDLHKSARFASSLHILRCCRLLDHFIEMTGLLELAPYSQKWYGYLQNNDNMKQRLHNYVRLKKLWLFPKKFGLDRTNIRDAPH